MQPMWLTSLEKPLHKPPMHTKAPESAFALVVFPEKKTCFFSVRGTMSDILHFYRNYKIVTRKARLQHGIYFTRGFEDCLYNTVRMKLFVQNCKSKK